MPTPEDISRRLGGALRLAGITAEELGRRMKEDGLGKTDPEQIMQGRKEMQRVHAEAFARHLNVPLDWFLVEDFHGWIREAAAESGAGEFRLSALASAVEANGARLEELTRTIRRLSDQRSPGEGNG